LLSGDKTKQTKWPIDEKKSSGFFIEMVIFWSQNHPQFNQHKRHKFQ